MARRRRRSWLAKRAEPGTHVPNTHTDGAEGAALGSQSEPTLHIIYRYRYIYTATTVHTGLESRRLLTLFFDHTDRAVDEIQATNLYTTKLCTTGMLFTPKAYQGSEKSTVDLSFSLSYFSKEVEVRDDFPVTIFRRSVRR